MSAVEWTAAEREALRDVPGLTAEEDDAILDALAPFVAARVERAVQDYAEREKPVLRIESAGQAKNLIEVAWHDIDKRVRQAKADALWEAADSWQTGGWADDLPPAGASRVQLILGMSQRACNWLRERADRIERGES